MFDFFNANVAIAMVIITVPFVFYGRIVGMIHKLAPKVTLKQIFIGTLITNSVCAIGYFGLFFVDWKTSAVTYVLLCLINFLFAKKVKEDTVNAMLSLLRLSQ